MHGIVAYTFLNVCEKNPPVSVKYYLGAHKAKLVLFFCLTVYIYSVII